MNYTLRHLLTGSIILFSGLAQAQEDRKSIAISYGTASGRFGGFRIMKGFASYDVKSLNSFGVTFFYETRKNRHIEYGLHYISFKYGVSPNINIPENHLYWNEELNLISVPLKLRYDAGKHFFFNGGFYLDIDVSKQNGYTAENHSGVGVGIGIGLQFHLKNKFSIYTNPQLDVRDLINIAGEKYANKLMAASLIFGLAYQIK